MSPLTPKQRGTAGPEQDGGRENGRAENGHSEDGIGSRTGVMRAGGPGAVRNGGGDGKTRVERETLKKGAVEAPLAVAGWLDERAGMSPLLRAMLYRKVPKGTNWFYTLGSSTMFAFLSQAVTGVFLAMYYDPSPTRAYESTRYITNEAFMGELVRGMHKWGPPS